VTVVEASPVEDLAEGNPAAELPAAGAEQNGQDEVRKLVACIVPFDAALSYPLCQATSRGLKFSSYSQHCLEIQRLVGQGPQGAAEPDDEAANAGWVSSSFSSIFHSVMFAPNNTWSMMPAG
jgi:hypothetical protein